MQPQGRLALPAYLPHQESIRPLRNLLAIFFRRKRIIALSFVGTFAGLVLAITLLPRSYKSELQILIERERFDPVVSPSSDGSLRPQVSRELTQQEINSEMDILKSDELQRAVVLRCKLHEPQSNNWLASLRYRISTLIYGDDPATRIALAMAALDSKLIVSPPNQSSLIKITYTSSDPRTSAQVLNELARAYLDKHVEVHRPSGTFNFFQQEANEYRKGLQAISSQLIEFSRKEGMFAVDQEKADALQKVGEFEAARQTTRAAIVETEHRIRQLEGELANVRPRMVTQVRSSPLLVEQMKTSLFNLELKRSELLTKFDPKYRAVQDVESQIAEARKAIQVAESAPTAEETTDRDPTYEWVRGELVKARADLNALRARATATNTTLQSYRQKLLRLEEKGNEQRDLLRSAKAAESNYLLYLQKREEARISDALDRQRIVNVAIAQAAMAPALPADSTLLKLALGFVVAVLVSLGLGFATDYFDPSFRSPEELEAYLDLPVLAAIAKPFELPQTLSDDNRSSCDLESKARS